MPRDEKIIRVSATERVRVTNHGDIGAAVVREEKRGGKSRFSGVEDTMIPRVCLEDVAVALLKMAGCTNITWEK